MAEKRWIAETLFDALGFRMTYAIERVLYEMQTEHQHLVLFEHKFFGKMLMLDGATQVTTRADPGSWPRQGGAGGRRRRLRHRRGGAQAQVGQTSDPSGDRRLGGGILQ